MNHSFKALVMLTFAAALSAGCSDSDDPPVNDTTASETSSPSPNSGPEPTVLTKFDGTFQTPCALSDPEDSTAGSEVVTTTISGAMGSILAMDYTDTNCAVPASPTEYLAEISIAYPEGTVETPLGTADFVNYTPESAMLDGQPLTTEQQTLLGSQGFFDTRFSLLLIVDDSLYFGDDSGELDGDTAETRPTTLSAVPAIRQ
ncbi:MAG: hypothetical protein AB8B64_04285 [Granulosicoccus sp.]